MLYLLLMKFWDQYLDQVMEIFITNICKKYIVVKILFKKYNGGNKYITNDYLKTLKNKNTKVLYYHY